MRSEHSTFDASKAVKLLLAALSIYVAYGITMSLLAHQILYPFDQTPFQNERFETETVVISDEIELPVGVADSGPGSATVLVFVGNTGSRAAFGPLYEPLLRSGATVIAVPFRGSEGISGTPRERSLIQDSREVLEAVPDILGRAPKKVAIAAYSLGTGVAIELAKEPAVEDLLLAAPYDKICGIMTSKSLVPACMIPWVDGWNSLARASAVSANVVIVHGDDDTLISIHRSERLARHLTSSGVTVKHIAIEGAGHNDIFLKQDFWDATVEWALSLRY